MSSRPRRINGLWRLSAVLSLAVSLILSLSPLVAAPVVAAPPETIREAATKPPDITPDSETKPEDPLTTETRRSPDNQDRVAADAAPNDRVDGDDGSVRLRGVEAPVQLEQKEARGADRPQVNAKSTDEPENEEQQDPGDGPVQKPHAPAKKRIPKRQQSGIRIWPMPAGSYTFTQQFGCVPQLGNLYFPGDGCPADRPVIHTGVDLAAPEGTPFYAAASGWVTLADYDRPTADANTRIIIQHDGRNEGYATDYLHWVASYVKEGDYVHAGDPIGEVGNVGFSTGPHLHFSVTDLGTGEHIDPLRWLPDEPGLEGYISRMPTARLRLPAGTTAGQPESADPAPPEPAVEKVVPESPPVNGRRGGTSGQRSERPRQERRAAANEEPAAKDAKRPGKKKSRDGAAPESTTPNSTTDSSTSDATKDRNRSRGQDPTRERTKSDAPPEDAANVDDSGSSDSQANSGKSDRRGNQETGGKEKGSPDSGGRAAPDTEPPDSSVPDEQGGRHDHNADHQTPDQSERNGGGHQGNGERRPKS